jgi:hypothetical protein
MTDAHHIIAGQSNALGYLTTEPAPYLPTGRVQIWCDTDGDGVPDAWNFMRPGANTGTQANPLCWGPEVGFANRWLAGNPAGNLWLVKAGCVKGSTELARDDAQGVLDWSPESTNELFATATTTIAAARAALNGGPYAFTGYDSCLWLQGEQDAMDQGHANSYDGNLRDFLTNVRANWSVNKVVIARISDSVALPYNEAVRLAQWSVWMDDPANSPSYPTKDLPRRQDNIHLTDAGQLASGLRWYQALQGP